MRILSVTKGLFYLCLQLQVHVYMNILAQFKEEFTSTLTMTADRCFERFESFYQEKLIK